jgi:hypothetical protein
MGSFGAKVEIYLYGRQAAAIYFVALITAARAGPVFTNERTSMAANV